MNAHPLRLIALVMVLATANACLAGIRPSFSLENSTWTASDIIVVKDDGEQRPRVTVEETWKGTLKPGDAIELVGLAAADAPKQTLAWNDSAFPDPVAGRKIVFFLRRQTTVENAFPRTTGKWVGVSWSERDLWASAAFIDGDAVQVFWQTMNPGPSTLQSNGITAGVLKSEVGSVLKACDALSR
jgi:hypothetical protein